MALKRKCIILTGASGNLGQYFTKVLIKNEYFVIGIDLKGQKVKSKYYEHFVLDICDEQAFTGVLKKVALNFGVPHALINNAGIDFPPSIESFKKVNLTSLEEWRKVIDVNLTGAFIATRNFANLKFPTSGAVVINIGSVYGKKVPDQSIYNSKKGKLKYFKPLSYCVSKAGLAYMTKYFADYVGRRNIRVNLLTVGGVEMGQSKEFVNKYSERTCLKRMANKEDILGVLLLLLSNDASYITGADFVVDGGFKV
jgi:NAD(P)-dependent dehydrogenase (short-subunit alcohol dehydrogenase family)